MLLTLLAAGDFCMLTIEGTGSFPPYYTQDNATDMSQIIILLVLCWRESGTCLISYEVFLELISVT